MWKTRSEPEKPVTPTQQPPAPMAPAITPKEMRPMEMPKANENFRADVAHIGKSVLVKGELSGSEDLYLDGEVEGSIELRDHSLVIGPHGRVRAHINARDVTVHGKVDGNVKGTERVELKKSAVLVGDINTQRIIIEDGAFFKGAIDIQKEGAKTTAKRESSVGTSAASSAATPAYSAAPAASGAAETPGYSASPGQKKY
jgi:cytoskeletal protein CcmA (bactofilin family)